MKASEQAILYARQSVGDEKESASVEEQLDACRRLAKTRGLNILGEYSDLNCSGVSYPSGAEQFAKSDKEWIAYCKGNAHVGRKPFRKGLGAALRHLGKADYLLVYDSTRLMRPLANSFLGNFISQSLISNGVKLLSVHDGEIDFQRFDSKLVQTIREQVEADIKEKLRQRSKEGIRRVKNEGGFLGGKAPYGYRMNKGVVTVVEKEAETVRRIFKRYLEEVALNNFIRILNSDAMEGRKRQWSHASIFCLLRQPAYIGMRRNGAGDLIASNAYPAIVDKERWFAAQAKLKKAREQFSRLDVKRTHFFRGIAYCGECGGRLHVGRNANATTFLRCATAAMVVKRLRSRECVMSRLNELDDWRQDAGKFRHHGLADCLAPLAILGAWKYAGAQARGMSSPERAVSLENALGALNRKLGEAKGMWMDNLLSTAEYQDMSKELKERIKAAKEESEALRDSTLKEKMSRLKNWSRIRDSIRNGTPPVDEMPELLHDVISRVMVFPYHVETTLYDGSSFKLERIVHRNNRGLPAWRWKVKDGKTEHDQVDVVTYLYKSYYKGDKTEERIYKSDALEIWTSGRNPEPRRWVLGIGYVPAKQPKE